MKSGLDTFDKRLLLVSAFYPIGLGLLVGVPGVLVGLLAMGIANFFGGPFGFGVAQIGLLIPEAGGGIFIAEAVFIGVLLTEVRVQYLLDLMELVRVSAGGVGLGLVALGIAALADFSLIVTLIGVIPVFTIGIYLLHRYEFITSGGHTEYLE